MKEKIVIYGGAFNPPHIGHAIAIDEVMRTFVCDEIWIMPSADRQDKKISVTGEHRVNMIKIILSELFSAPKVPIKISTLELKRPALTTTYDTQIELNKKYPNNEFYFLVGKDIFKDIKIKWVNGKKLLRIAKFITVSKKVNVSSTFVRELISKDQSGVPYIIPAVARYIQENGFYRFNKQE
ncbi:MAG: nicotinate-nicotinamide nucleotide adenylyltransferase [Patescibacteria group bacterium]